MRRGVLGLVLLIVLGGMIVAPAVAQSEPQGDDADYTLEELRKDGTHYKKPTARIAGEHVYWVTHQPADKPWQSEKKILEKTTVKSNTLWINSIRTANQPANFTVHIVFWELGTNTKTVGNTTTTEQYAKNVTKVTQQIQLGQGWPAAKIRLPNHDQPVRMTIWIDGLGEEARWTLRHHSIATSKPISITSAGEYQQQAFTDYILPILAGLLFAYVGKRHTLAKTKAPTMWGVGGWVFLLTVGAGILVTGFFASLAELFVALPVVIPAYVTVVAFAIMYEGDEGAEVEDLEVLVPDLEKATSPSGESAVDMEHADRRTFKIVRSAEGVQVVAKGLFAAAARYFGGATHLENGEQIENAVRLSDGTLLLVANPLAEEPIQHEREGWSWNLPIDEQKGQLAALATVGAIVGATALTFHYFGGLAAGAVGAAGLLISREPVPGSARIEPAPGHLRSAWTSKFFLAKELDEGETIEEERKKRIQEQVRNQKDVEEALEEQDSTLVQEMFNSEASDLSSLEDRLTSEVVEADD